MFDSIPKLAPVLMLATCFSVAPQWFAPSQAQAPQTLFKCELVNGSPLTMVKTVRGSMPMIQWVKSFGGTYQNLNRRCNEVSMRLDRFNRDGKLGYIRTGNLNSYPVLCVDKGVSGNTCPKTNVLVTLPKGTDSSLVLQQMLDLRARASGSIIQLSGNQLVQYRNGDAYVSVAKLLGK